MGAIFREIGWGKIDGNLAVWEGEAGVYEGATNALARFVNSFGCHADDIKGGKAFVRVAFDFDKAALVAVGTSRIYFCYHTHKYKTMGLQKASTSLIDFSDSSKLIRDLQLEPLFL